MLAVAMAAVRRLSEFNAWCSADTAWVLATVDQSGAPEYVTLALAAERRLSDFKA